VTVSTGFVSSCLVRLDTALTTAGFEDALKDALRAAEVLGTDETPAPLTDQATRAPGCHHPHVYTVRTMRGYTRTSAGGQGPSRDLVWYGCGRRPDQGLDQRVRDPGHLPGRPGPRRLRRLPQLRRRPGRRPAVPGARTAVPGRRPRDRSTRPGLGRSDRRHAAESYRRGQHRPRRRPNQPAPAPASPAAPLPRQRRRGRDLHEHLEAMAQGQPPRTPTRQAPAPQGRPAVDLRDPVRRPRHEQRIGVRHPWLQAGRQGQRMLADPDHPATPLPDPLLPDQLPQPRTPTPRHDQGRPHRHTLDATNHSLIN
jgi:hypothetical protein